MDDERSNIAQYIGTCWRHVLEPMNVANEGVDRCLAQELARAPWRSLNRMQIRPSEGNSFQGYFWNILRRQALLR